MLRFSSSRRARQEHREASRPRGRAGPQGEGEEGEGEEEEEGVEGPEAGGQGAEEEDDDAEWYRQEVGEEPGEYSTVLYCSALFSKPCSFRA